MCERRSRRVVEFGQNAQRQHLPQLDTPLIERIDVPDRALREDAVLVQRDELAERRRGQPLHQIVFDGWFPGKVRCGTSQSGEPSSRTSTAVLPKARASLWAKTLANSMSCCCPSGFSGWAKAMKSQGIRRVPR